MVYTLCPDATEQQLKPLLGTDFDKTRHTKNAKYFEECVKVIKTEKLRTEREELLDKIKQHPEDATLLQRLATVSNEINSLK